MPVREFWEEEPEDERGIFRRHAARLSVIFLTLCALVAFAFWWSGSAVRFGASRLAGTTAATYRVVGIVTDATTGAPIPWATVQDDPSGRPPFFQTTSSVSGTFELWTVAEPHFLLISALGYQPKRVGIGRVWYLWLPTGEQQVNVALDRERSQD